MDDDEERPQPHIRYPTALPQYRSRKTVGVQRSREKPEIQRESGSSPVSLAVLCCSAPLDVLFPDSVERVASTTRSARLHGRAGALRPVEFSPFEPKLTMQRHRSGCRLAVMAQPQSRESNYAVSPGASLSIAHLCYAVSPAFPLSSTRARFRTRRRRWRYSWASTWPGK
jgi:hypothetical protein